MINRKHKYGSRNMSKYISVYNKCKQIKFICHKAEIIRFYKKEKITAFSKDKHKWDKVNDISLPIMRQY